MGGYVCVAGEYVRGDAYLWEWVWVGEDHPGALARVQHSPCKAVTNLGHISPTDSSLSSGSCCVARI